MDTRQDELKKDLDAAVQARKELGKEFESELVDSFLARIDARLDARVEQRVAERLGGYGPAGAYPPADAYAQGGPHGHPGRRRGRFGGAGRMPVLSLVMGVPLSGIAAGTSGFMGLLVCWAGIVGVNFAAVQAEKREERDAKGTARSEWA
ncbi:hypothetical protein ACFVH7_17080 [Kitasatospora indigofera]|uniref:hypothetical protein n=1 Tax=Kitasatospora indigofera TaxID=67307 RepID=UPI003645ED36